MTAQSPLDPESFQRLLSNAFAVQESGMDNESLSAIVELQESIATGELDLDGAMDLIAVRARNVANAAGIAIGLLQGDQLVYRAGSGSTASFVGQHVMATLCISPHNPASGEILRVENAQTDARIEAAICRQFGALSLLILPIYHRRTVAGVLEVLFNEPHAFQHREVRSYRLMAALVGEAMSHASRPVQNKALAADLPAISQSLELMRPQIEKALPADGSVSAAATNRAISQGCGNPLAEAGKLPVLSQSAWTASKRAKRVPLFKGRWETAVAVAAVLVIAFWIGYRNRRPASRGEASTQGSSALVPAKRGLANSTSKSSATLGLKKVVAKKAAKTMPQRVVDRNSQIRHISDDVTVRYFTPQLASLRVVERNTQVHHISDDVTVRYFTPQPVPQRVVERNSQVRQISDDVTVRYFTPHLASQRVVKRNSHVHHISEDVTVRYFTPHNP
jgi:hypothetical protein